MSEEEFNLLLTGPLHHPVPAFTLARLALALRSVVNATGEAGANALREYCRQRDADDRRKEGQ